jgi:hypothetical protein
VTTLTSTGRRGAVREFRDEEVDPSALAIRAQPAVPVNARRLQRDWDSVIVIRATLQGFAVAALCVALLA